MSADAWILLAFALMALAVIVAAVALGRGRFDAGFEPRPYLVVVDDAVRSVEPTAGNRGTSGP